MPGGPFVVAEAPSLPSALPGLSGMIVSGALRVSIL